MLIVRIARGLLHLYFAIRDAKPPARRGKPPDSYTRSEVESLPRGAGPLLGIALCHPDEGTAALAAERIEQDHLLHILSLYQEAPLLARMTAVRRLRHRPDILVEVAIRDDDAALAMYASHLVESPTHIAKLHDSKYETVRMVALMKEHRPQVIERLLKDPSEQIRERASMKLRLLTAN